MKPMSALLRLPRRSRRITKRKCSEKGVLSLPLPSSHKSWLPAFSNFIFSYLKRLFIFKADSDSIKAAAAFLFKNSNLVRNLTACCICQGQHDIINIDFSSPGSNLLVCFTHFPEPTLCLSTAVFSEHYVLGILRCMGRGFVSLLMNTL